MTIITKAYTKFNFHSHTFCIWREVPLVEIDGLKISYTSQSGSQYIFTVKGLYRISNHWGRVANCHWRLVPMSDFKNQSITVAFAHWTDFYANDDGSKLFFVKVNWDTKEVSFYHKLTSEIEENIVLRNAKETAKTIRTIKMVLTQNDWAKYLKYTDFEVLRHEIVAELVNSNKSFLEIKKCYL